MSNKTRIDVIINYVEQYSTCQRAPINRNDYRSDKKYIEAESEWLMNNMPEIPNRSVKIEKKIFNSIEEFKEAIRVQFGEYRDLQEAGGAIFPNNWENSQAWFYTISKS